ncbi:MAG: hypothetical protein KAG96_02055 [Ichthyobacteriaceae bacterium]|nr:hypothetical protein [Ichthyobacteriaceae bacterium]
MAFFINSFIINYPNSMVIEVENLVEKEQINALKVEFYKDKSNFERHINLFETNISIIEKWYDSDNSDLVLLGFRLAIVKYIFALISTQRTKHAEEYILLLEKKLRSYKHSEAKQELLELFQYYKAHTFYLNHKYYKSKQAYNLLLQCKPDNIQYIDGWRDTEFEISKNTRNFIMIGGIIIFAISRFQIYGTQFTMNNTTYLSMLFFVIGWLYTPLKQLQLRYKQKGYEERYRNNKGK